MLSIDGHSAYDLWDSNLMRPHGSTYNHEMTRLYLLCKLHQVDAYMVDGKCFVVYDGFPLTEYGHSRTTEV